MKNKILNYIRAGYSCLYIVSPEEARVEAELKGAANQSGFALYFWSITTGLVNGINGQVIVAGDPLEAIQTIPELPERSLVILRDFLYSWQIPILSC